jgi:hypothetical protein
VPLDEKQSVKVDERVAKRDITPKPARFEVHRAARTFVDCPVCFKLGHALFKSIEVAQTLFKLCATRRRPNPGRQRFRAIDNLPRKD